MRVVKIADIELEYPLWVKEEFSNKRAKAVSFRTLSGGILVYESTKRDNSNYITLESRKGGWIKKDTIKNILDIVDDVGVVLPLTFDTGEVINVRPALEKGDIIQVEDIITDGSSWKKVTINFCRV